MLDYVKALLSDDTPTAVDSIDKLPVTWAAIKAAQ